MSLPRRSIKRTDFCFVFLQLHYRVVSGNSADLIHLTETTGYITLSSNLNTNVPISAAMEISVSGKWIIFFLCFSPLSNVKGRRWQIIGQYKVWLSLCPLRVVQPRCYCLSSRFKYPALHLRPVMARPSSLIYFHQRCIEKGVESRSLVYQKRGLCIMTAANMSAPFLKRESGSSKTLTTFYHV